MCALNTEGGGVVLLNRKSEKNKANDSSPPADPQLIIMIMSYWQSRIKAKASGCYEVVEVCEDIYFIFRDILCCIHMGWESDW